MLAEPITLQIVVRYRSKILENTTNSYDKKVSLEKCVLTLNTSQLEYKIIIK